MEDYKPTEYTLECVATGREFEDKGWMLDDTMCGEPSLVRTKYTVRQLRDRGPEYGLYRYSDWLPVNRMLEGSSAPVTYKSEKLAKHLGLENLFITFSGFWPEIGAAMSTCSFKETEAYSVCGRMKSGEDRVLVVASAGNTARAFARVCSDNDIPLLLCVPYDNINALWFDRPVSDCVKLVCSERGSDYFDAIHLSNLVLASDKFLAEGGAKNVARRDGMATTMLSAATFIGEIPDYYFQAIGSGTGAIAAWEANMRLIQDGRFGRKKSKLVLSQNTPFLPMYKAWKERSRTLPAYEDAQARAHAEEIDAKVLSNRRPPYSLAGGLFDALKDTGGDIMKVGNEELREAARLFEQLEGIDIHPAAAAATASLIESVKSGTVAASDTVMLNITGGGERRFRQGIELHYLQPSLIFPVDPDPSQVQEKVSRLF